MTTLTSQEQRKFYNEIVNYKAHLRQWRKVAIHTPSIEVYRKIAQLETAIATLTTVKIGMRITFSPRPGLQLIGTVTGQAINGDWLVKADNGSRWQLTARQAKAAR